MILSKPPFIKCQLIQVQCENCKLIRTVQFRKNRSYCYCPKCSKNKFDISLVIDYIKNKGCYLLEKEVYYSSSKKLKIQCQCGNIFTSSFHDFKKGKRCKNCGKRRRVRKPTKDIETTIRNKNRIISGYGKWKKKVKERDNYICQCCNYKGKILDGIMEAHHLENFSDNIELSLEIINGITLCEKCHKDFHRLFGKKNNTRKQFDIFLQSKRKD